MATYVNDLRLKEIGTGESSGTWGTETNTNLELIGEALGYATEGITTNADTHATTVADGSTDPGRAMYIKYTGTLDSACTITIGPNTMTRVHIIENATSGSQNIIIKQGSGAEITIPNGYVKAVYLDGAGSGAAVIEAFDNLSVGTNFRIGNGAAEDTTIIFDGNAQDFYIGLDDSADDLVFGKGSALGTTQAMAIDENMDVAFGPTTNVTITNDGNEDNLTLTSTDADANAGPNLRMYRNSSSPADADVLGVIDYEGRNDNSQDVVYASITAQANDVSDGSEDGSYYLSTMVAGTLRNRMNVLETETVFNQEAIDLDFRIESDNNTHMFYVDAGSDHINIGTSTDHGGIVNIQSTDNSVNLALVSTDTDGSAGPHLDLTRDAGNVPSDGDVMGKIRFRNDNTDLVMHNYASIESRIDDVSAGTEDGRLEFTTAVAGTEDVSRIMMDGTKTIVNDNGQNIDFVVESDNDNACFYIDAGNDTVLLGNDTSRLNWYNSTVYGASLQIETLATQTRYLSIGAVTNSNDANGAYLGLGSTRGTSAGAVTVVQANDFLGSLNFQGADGTNLVNGADIAAQVALTPGANDMPTHLQLRTTPDGGSSPTERVRVQHDGAVRMGGDTFGNITGGMNYLTLADDATKTIALSGTATAGGALLVIYESASGDNALYHVGYGNCVILNANGSYATSDTDGKFCVIVSGHNISFKNRIGSQRNFNLMVYGAGNFNYNL